MGQVACQVVNLSTHGGLDDHSGCGFVGARQDETISGIAGKAQTTEG